MRIVCAVFGALVLLGAACSVAQAADKVYAAASRPAQVKLPETIRRLAVVEFTAQDQESRAYAGIAASRLNSFLAASPCAGVRYELIDRTHLRGVLAEQDLGASGITDPKTAVEAGKLLNADAIIFGTVHVEKSEEHSSRQGISVGYGVPSLGGGTSVKRSVLVNVTFNMIQPETGAVLATRSVSRSHDSGKGGPLKKILGKGNPSPEAVISSLIEQCVVEYGQLVASHVQVYEFELSSSRGSKAGNAMARAGQFAAAAEQYRLAVEKNAKDHGTVYNLGVAQLMLNDVDGAIRQVDRAIAMKDDKKYIEARQQLSEIAASAGVQVRPATAREIGDYKAQNTDD